MVRLDRIYTRGGDKGMTSLTGGERRPKYDLRIEAYGTVDELNACIGVARLHVKNKIDLMLARIQQDLFDLGADLSTPMQSVKKAKDLRVLPAQVKRLEQEIDILNKEIAPLNSFVLPAGKDAAAYLHLARTVCRRAERLVCELSSMEAVNEVVLQYLNRLSDHLFVLARYSNAKGKCDVLWVPGANQ